NWLSPIDSLFTRVTSSLKIVGLHKYLHYRRWFRRELADYLKDVVSSARTQQAPFWNRRVFSKMGFENLERGGKFLFKINAVLTLEAIERLLLEQFAAARPASDNCPDTSSVVAEQPLWRSHHSRIIATSN